MQLVETLPVGEGTAQWELWGTVARIVVTDPATLAEATAIVRAETAAVTAAALMVSLRTGTVAQMAPTPPTPPTGESS